MQIFKIPFRKVVYGVLTVKANSLEDVKKNEWKEEIDEFDNKSDFEFDYKRIEREAR